MNPEKNGLLGQLRCRSGLPFYRFSTGCLAYGASGSWADWTMQHQITIKSTVHGGSGAKYVLDCHCWLLTQHFSSFIFFNWRIPDLSRMAFGISTWMWDVEPSLKLLFLRINDDKNLETPTSGGRSGRCSHLTTPINCIQEE